MKACATGESVTGRVRDRNEDAFLIDQDHGVFVVCDGMGGHAAGDKASQLAIQTVQEGIERNSEVLLSFRAGKGDERRIVTILKYLVQTACEKIYRHARENPPCRGMGTTLSLLLVGKDRVAIAHVGDSRIYLIRGQELHQLTIDHTVGARLLAQGELTESEIAQSPYRHVLTRALGQQEIVEVDSLIVEVFDGDKFLLCTDGLSGAISDPGELTAILSSTSLQQLPMHLCREADARDGSDNSTAIVLELKTTRGAEAEKVREKEYSLRLSFLQQLYLFNGLSLSEISKVMEHVVVQEFDPGAVVITQGEDSASLYLLLEGSVSVNRDGIERSSLSQGQHFGEMALLADTRRTASVICTESVRVLKLERSDFRSLVQTYPSLGTRLLWALGKELSTRLERTMGSMAETAPH